MGSGWAKIRPQRGRWSVAHRRFPGARAVVSLSLSILVSRWAAAQGYEIVQAFNASQGGPFVGLTEGPGGSLYGVDVGGGIAGSGSVFALDPDGGGGFTYRVVHFFTGMDGWSPHGRLILAPDGYFYGTT